MFENSRLTVSFTRSLKINYTICEEKNSFIQSRRETTFESMHSNVGGEWGQLSVCSTFLGMHTDKRLTEPLTPNTVFFQPQLTHGGKKYHAKTKALTHWFTSVCYSSWWVSIWVNSLLHPPIWQEPTEKK